MLELGQVIGQIAQLIRELLWPFFIVASPNRGVRYTNGVAMVVKYPVFGRKPPFVTLKSSSPILEPGLYFAMPFFQEIRKTNCAEDYMDVMNLSLTTKDDVAVTVSYNMGYYVSDILKYQKKLRADEVDKNGSPAAIHAAGAVEVSAHVTSMTWKEIVSNQEILDNRIHSSLKSVMKDWGITVISGGITVCTKAKPIALIRID